MHRLLRPRLPALAWSVLAFLLLFSAVNSDSLDMDEAQTWDYARLPAFSKLAAELNNDMHTQAQMPLGTLAAWTWARVAGTSELGLRSLNWLWALVAVAAMASAGRRIRLPWLPALFAIQPFVWYHMDFARPPMMQMAGGALLLAGTVALIDRREFSIPTALWIFSGTLIVCGTSILGLLPVMSLVLCGSFYRFRKTLLPRGRTRYLVIPGTVLLVGLLIYYLLTLIHGAGDAKIWGVSPANLLFTAYEYLGFQGLGPGRQELRAVARGLTNPAILLPCLPGFLALIIAYSYVFAAAFKSWLTRETTTERPSSRRLRLWALGLAVPALSALCLFFLGLLAGFPFWGRHLAAGFPFWILSLGLTLRWASQGMWRHSGRTGATVLIALLLLSSLLLLLAPYHAHDNYRAAAGIAAVHARSGKSVWWVADHSGGAYYGVRFSRESTPMPGEIQFAPNQHRVPSPEPDVIVLSRPDNFDQAGVAAAMIKSGHYVPTSAFKEFSIWERRP